MMNVKYKKSKNFLSEFRRKIYGTEGFTLSETLMTVVLIGLVTAAMAAGIAAAQRVYKRISLKADAQTLLATTVSALTEDLASASEWDPDDQTFYSSHRGYEMSYVEGSDSKGKNEIKIQPYIQKQAAGAPISLLPERVQTKSLYAKIKGTDEKGTIKQEDCADGTHYFRLTVEVWSTESSYQNPIESEEICIHNHVKD